MKDPGPIAAHGGKLIRRLVPEGEIKEAQRQAKHLPKIVLTRRRLADLEMLAVGGFSPLKGFLSHRDYESVLEKMRLANGLLWPIPITLAVSHEEESHLREGRAVALVDESEEPLAVLHLKEKFPCDKEKEAQFVFQTADPHHPGVAALYARGDILLGGDVDVLSLPRHRGFRHYRLTPLETRSLFDEKGWRRVVGFQTRNPIHRAHEYIQKCALEICDGMLLHPLVGATKGDDVPADVRMRCYEALLTNYYPKERVILSVNPANMYYAGPREAIFHAIIRKNYGCTHFVVGRDHAGVGNYYGPFDAQKIFDEFPPVDLGIIPLFFDNSFFCRLCGQMASAKTCPHGEDARVALSGTKVREMLSRMELPPKEFSRPEVAQILAEAMSAKRQ